MIKHAQIDTNKKWKPHCFYLHRFCIANRYSSCYVMWPHKSGIIIEVRARGTWGGTTPHTYTHTHIQIRAKPLSWTDFWKTKLGSFCQAIQGFLG